MKAGMKIEIVRINNGVVVQHQEVRTAVYPQSEQQQVVTVAEYVGEWKDLTAYLSDLNIFKDE